MNKKRKIFFTSLYIVSLLIMVIGSTLSFFSYRTTSDKDIINIDSTKDTTIGVVISQTMGGGSLFPLRDEDIMTAYNNGCIDINRNSACNGYTIDINNGNNKAMYLSGKINFTKTNNLVNLYYMVLDSNGSIYMPATKIEDSKEFSLGEMIKLEPLLNQKFILLVWLRNLNESQNAEMGGSYSGKISYTAVDDIKLIGQIESLYVGG